MPDFLACFGCKLIKMPIGVGDKEDRSGATIEFVDRPPSKSIDRSLLANSCIDLCDFVVSAKVEDSNMTIRISTGCHGIFLVELGDHELRFLGNDSFHENFVLEWYFLEDSG